MASLNKVMLIGNTGKDAELRYTANGTPTSQFSLAVNYRRKGQSGDWEDQTEWFNIVLFGDRAERISQYISKGKQLYIEGRLQTRTWDDDQGTKHYRTEVIANAVEFLSPRDGGQGGGSGEWGDGGSSFRGGGNRAAAAGAGEAAPTEVDDLPFE
ncbi:MAG: single-stranded DNA-binding protein [Tepidiformaceae bacterium]